MVFAESSFSVHLWSGTAPRKFLILAPLPFQDAIQIVPANSHEASTRGLCELPWLPETCAPVALCFVNPEPSTPHRIFAAHLVPEDIVDIQRASLPQRDTYRLDEAHTWFQRSSQNSKCVLLHQKIVTVYRAYFRAYTKGKATCNL